MPELSIFASPAPYHILTYGTLLGTEFFQSFIGGIVAYKALPRPQFASLQQAIFPIYFSLQTALPVILALTYPGTNSSLGTAAVPSSLGGVFAEKNRTSVLAPLVTIFASSLVNLALVGPATTKIMRERKHQETRDGKKSYDSPPHSKEMMRMNKSFGRMHGVSSLLNLGGLLATMWYGFTLAERLQ
ncbi:hypothetical protein MMC14_006001 [Varicellaria rhodocarpa]|nr:hypothetical protein [Varicellaria rhodocarpa]